MCGQVLRRHALAVGVWVVLVQVGLVVVRWWGGVGGLVLGRRVLVVSCVVVRLLCVDGVRRVRDEAPWVACEAPWRVEDIPDGHPYKGTTDQGTKLAAWGGDR